MTIGYNTEKECFVINEQQNEITFEEFLKLSNTKYNGNVDEIKMVLNNLLFNSNR